MTFRSNRDSKRPELQLLLRCLTQELGSEAIAETIRWPLFYQLVLRHRVWHRIQESNLTLPESVQTKLAKLCQGDKHQLLRIAAETARIGRLFNKNKLLYCFVKGVVLNLLVYDRLQSRPCRDVDLWVNPSHFEAAMNLLLQEGYERKSTNYDLVGFKKRYFMKKRHDLVFVHPDRNIIIELHFKLGYQGALFPDPSLETIQTMDMLNEPVLVLTNNHHALYLIVHGATHAWIRLRWLKDIHLFLQLNRCDLEQVLSLAKQIGCAHMVVQCLLLLRDFFDHESSKPWVENPSPKAKKLYLLAKSLIEANYELADGLKQPLSFFNYRRYLLHLASSGQAWGVLMNDLFKIDEVFPLIKLPECLSPLYYVLYPAWVIRYVGKACFKRQPKTKS